MDYLGYAVAFIFEEDGIEWSVYVNEAGVLVTEEPNKSHYQYPNYDEFMLAFPVLAAEVKLIVLKKVSDTMLLMKQVVL